MNDRSARLVTMGMRLGRRVRLVALFGLLFLAVAMVGGLIAVANAAPKGTATDAIRDANKRLNKLLAQEVPDKPVEPKLAEQITKELRDLFDIGFLAQRALVDHWDKMTAAQREAITTTLREIVEKNYISQLRSNLEYQVEYKGEETKGDETTVHTIIRAKRNGRPTKIKVDYRLVYENDHWRVFDVITEDVSILQNYRSQFNRIIDKDGVDGLIKRMKDKLDKGEQ